MRKIIAIVFCAVALAGCAGKSGSGSGTAAESAFTSEVTHRLSDGRTVTCLTYNSGYGGGISCDWENAKVRQGLKENKQSSRKPRKPRFDWPVNDVLESMVSEHGYRGTAKIIGCSDNAVRKRLRQSPLA